MPVELRNLVAGFGVVSGLVAALLASSPAPDDADGDGMADSWEAAHGLDVKSADDRNATTLDPPYTNLEVYLNSLADGSDSK